MSTARLHSQSITKSDARNYLWYEKKGHACNSKSNMKNITGLLHERFQEKMGATQTQTAWQQIIIPLYWVFILMLLTIWLCKSS